MEIKKIIVGMQMLFVAFGSLVLVPLLTGLDANVALFTAGVGTLLFHFVTKGQVPIFLASSFAYIAPIIAATKLYGLKGTLGGLVAAGFVQMFFAGAIKRFGIAIVHRFLPSHVIGPVIIVIGLSLAPVAIGMAKNTEAGPNNIYIAVIAMFTTIIISLFAKGTLKLIPIIGGIAAGYTAAMVLGIVDMQPIFDAPWLRVPAFVFPEFNWRAILFLIPVVLAPTIEHIGDIMVISNVTGKKFYADPGFHRTLFGDGLATSFAGMVGGPPNTTYSEVTGAVALTKVFDPKVLRISAIFAIILSFVGKLGAFLSTIPAPVMGGIMIILFGTIASIGIKNMVEHKVDFTSNKNLIIVAVILVVGIGGASLNFGQFTLEGIGLSGLVGVFLNII
ncbi:MAG: uracil-xanthine permease family protein, partial [Spirochaetota bacterium]